MAERATDLRDIERRVVAHLVGEPEPGVPSPEHPSILVAEDLAPSDTAGLDPAVILGLVTERGGPTSHTAIIARQLGIPCLVGVHGAVAIASGTALLIDGERGTVELGPDAEEADRRVAADRAERALLAGWTGPARTTDGIRVKVLANVADGESARVAAAGAGRGSRPLPHRAVLPEPAGRAFGRRAGGHLRRGPATRSRTGTATSWSARSTPARTSRWRSPPTTARRTPPSACAGCGCPSTTLACSTTRSTGSPSRRNAPAHPRG